MSRWKGALSRLRALFSPSSAERRMEEEFAFHLDMEAEKLESEGLAPDEARRRARLRFGGIDRFREEVRDTRARWLSDLRDDVKYGARMLWKNKGLTGVAIASLAVGIGANSAVFSLVNSLLLSPRPFAQPERIVQIYGGRPGMPFQSVSYPSYLDLRDRNEVFSGLAAYSVGWQFRLSGDDGVAPIWGEVVSGNYFDVLGVAAQVGRTFAPDEDQVPSRDLVAVIGHGLWTRRFGADPAVVGRTVTINERPLTVVGIAPPEYGGMVGGWATEIWVPATAAAALDPRHGMERLTSRGHKWVTMVGRLRPDVTMEQARARFDLVVQAIRTEHPDEWIEEGDGELAPTVISMLPESETRVHPGMRGPAYGAAALVLVIVNLVLLVACMNLASLLLARAVTRRGEIAVRLALGAGRARITRQLLTESILLSLVAGATGFVLSYWVLHAVIAAMPALPEGIRIALDVRLDTRVLAATIAFSTLTGVLFGLAPAVHATRCAVSSVLQDESQTFIGHLRTSRARGTLLVGQVALSLLLLAGAGLLLRDLESARPDRLGYASENVVLAPLALDEARDRRQAQSFWERILEEVSALPGVRSASLVEGIPGGLFGRSRTITEIEGYETRPGERLEIDSVVAGPRYMTNMQIPIIAGRDFTPRDRDGAPCVAMVNEPFAQRYLWGTSRALGRRLARFRSEDASKEWCEIVGVVRDDRAQSWQPEPLPSFALPLLQSDRRRMTLLVHASGGLTGLAASVRTAIREIDPTVPATEVQTLEEYFGTNLYPFRILSALLAGCGAVALLLATLGMYGSVAWSAAQRRREVGLRMALGALRADIVRLMVRQSLRLVALGLAIGIALSALLARALTLLPPDAPTLLRARGLDVTTLGALTALLVVVALVACAIPAARASRVDPAATLRSL